MPEPTTQPDEDTGERVVVDRVPIQPADDGPKRQFWRPVYLILWSDGSVTWEAED